MSRTKKGSKGPGYEFWSRRPNKGRDPGKDTKKNTHRLERKAGKQEAQDGQKEENDEIVYTP